MSKQSLSWLKLIQTISAVEAKLSKVLQAQHGLGLSEYRALEILARSANAEMRMQELASYLGLNQSSISRLVERLERDNSTVRDLCPDDKRGIYTVLTDTGRNRFESAKTHYEETLSAALKEYGCENLLFSAGIIK